MAHPKAAAIPAPWSWHIPKPLPSLVLVHPKPASIPVPWSQYIPAPLPSLPLQAADEGLLARAAAMLGFTRPENLVLGLGEKVTLEDQRWRVKRKGMGVGEREEEWGEAAKGRGKGT